MRWRAWAAACRKRSGRAIVALGLLFGAGLAAAQDPPPLDEGALIFSAAGKAERFDFRTGRSASTPLGPTSTRRLGHASGLVTDIQAETSSRGRPNVYTVHVNRIDRGTFEPIGTMPPFEIPGGRISGPMLPAPNLTRFVSQSERRAQLGGPLIEEVLVFDRGMRVTGRLQGLRDPAWLDSARLVAANDDGLVLIDLAATPVNVSAIAAGMSAPHELAVSPDGSAIAFVSGDAIWRIDADGHGLLRLTRPHGGQHWPAWSSDGQHLIVPLGVCPLFGAGGSAPELVWVSARSADQDITSALRVLRDRRLPLRACGPVYWIR